jgi:hypothetical protein
MFVDSCKQLMAWIESHPVLSFSAGKLACVEGDYVDCIRKIITQDSLGYGFHQYRYSADTSLEHSSVCYWLVKEISKLKFEFEDDNIHVMGSLGSYLNGDLSLQTDLGRYQDSIRVLRDVALDGLYEYLDENLDERNAIYSILVKYKQRSEWFRKERLRDFASKGLEGKTGERALALDVQEYILDQGVEFLVEPASASGEVDLLLKSSEGRYLVVDAKYIKDESTPSKICEKLASGFHQVMRYCSDFNTQEGFLVNFVASPIKIRLELDFLDGFHYLNIGGKVIYYIEINIADQPSASKSGKATTIGVSKAELIKQVEANVHSDV